MCELQDFAAPGTGTNVPALFFALAGPARTPAGPTPGRRRYGFALFARLRLRGAAESAISTGVAWGHPHARCSESKLQGKLDEARRQRRKNLIEGWRTDVAVGQAEIRVVQNIEELSAELKLLALGYANVLER